LGAGNAEAEGEREGAEEGEAGGLEVELAEREVVGGGGVVGGEGGGGGHWGVEGHGGGGGKGKGGAAREAAGWAWGIMSGGRLGFWWRGAEAPRKAACWGARRTCQRGFGWLVWTSLGIYEIPPRPRTDT
jgi:hypothetical protein